MAAQVCLPAVLIFNPADSAVPSVSVDTAAISADVATALPAAGRHHIGMVFQHFALFPNMRVAGMSAAACGFRALPPPPVLRVVLLDAPFTEATG
ncbi:hypothetical protein [Roseicyclus mahoneyensis]|jgi:ABC-type Fe3+/spermidine/putrescine transport system ATPase subunit|uniref:Uncharacterized protein n=1 Tax=Roseicyclus mahoneyensis TaxID=164332 RepID=A0A316GL82_9RHOB|nr:hypothetical protein [Roseicyclus mahoneyensis]PWK61437.1 hypothetical protein C7455_102125 [Roseicyclus mahoneyensis]